MVRIIKDTTQPSELILNAWKRAAELAHESNMRAKREYQEFISKEAEEFEALGFKDVNET
jgi:vacuolar-type H+-ATPase subunit H